MRTHDCFNSYFSRSAQVNQLPIKSPSLFLNCAIQAVSDNVSVLNAVTNQKMILCLLLLLPWHHSKITVTRNY